MKRQLLCLLALILLLTGCTTGSRELVQFADLVPYSQMEYVRPDLQQMQSLLDDVCTLARGSDADAILDAVEAFYDGYDRVYTSGHLADIGISSDLTDAYWAQEYELCMSVSPSVDAMLENMYRALAQSPCCAQLEKDFFGKDFFEEYRGEPVLDEGAVRLLEQDSALQSRYYALQDTSLEQEDYLDTCADALAQVLVDMIRLRRETAAYFGFDSYEEFAGWYYYGRLDDPEKTGEYLDSIRQTLVPLYRQYALDSVSDVYSGEEDTFEFVKGAACAMGGEIWDAWSLMEGGGLYDITWSPDKYNSSFEVYLTTYYEPFLFMNPQLNRYDCLTMAHEFGHYCNDYSSAGSTAGLEVTEFFSQGMEYLSLFYGENADDLIRLKLADSLCTYVEQACFAQFERSLYTLPEDQLNAQGLYDLYARTAASYGFDTLGFDPRDFVTVTHFYTNPMYVISYVVSNDAAMQLYAMEQSKPGSGLKLYKKNLECYEPDFETFLAALGLESPYTPGRIDRVEQILRTALQ